MSGAMQATYRAQGDRRILTILHRCERPRAALLIAPPFMHEHTLSYRLFALLADELAKRQVAVLRFHYVGMGDSDGDERDFSLTGAYADAAAATTALHEHSPGIPLHAMGVRAGAFVAAQVAERTSLKSLWFWQPVIDGRDYLRHLRDLDIAERNATERFLARPPEHREIDAQETLVGFTCSQQLLGELDCARLVATPAWPGTHILEVNETTIPFPVVQRIALPPALGSWPDRIYMDHAPLAAIRDIADRLSAAMEIT